MNLAVGDFVSVIIDFLIVAFVIFLIAKYAKKMGLSEPHLFLIKKET